MKKTFAAMLCLLTLFSLCFVVADGEETFCIKLSSAEVKSGENVDVTVSLESNPGIAALVITVEYDTEALTLLNAENGELFDSMEFAKNIVWDSGSNVTANGVLAILTFTAKEEAEGAYPITVKVRECRNAACDDLTLATINGSITVKQACKHKNTIEVKAVPSTCSEQGHDSYVICNDCSEIISGSDEKFPLAEHTPGNAVKENVIAVQCTTAGSYDEVVYCTFCKTELSRKKVTIGAPGHQWDAGVITTVAEIGKAGVKTFTCTVCKTTRTESIPALTGKPGDIDGNGQLEAADARLVLRAAVGLEKLNANQTKLADVDKSGKIEAADARLILRAAVGLEDTKKW